MSKILVLLLITLFTFIHSQSIVTPKCSSSSDCNTLSTFHSKVCSSTVCNDRPRANYQDLKSNHICDNSFSMALHCGKLVANNCTFTIGEILYKRCIDGSRSSVTDKCQARTTTQVLYSSLNGRCDTTATPVPDICPRNQQCLNNVCRERLKLGEFCRSGGLSCISGSVCDGARCVLGLSRNDGDKCHSSSVCKSQICSSGRCVSDSGHPCFANSDCGGNGVCKKAKDATTDVRGNCFDPIRKAQSDLNYCQYWNCNNKPLTAGQTAECINRCSKEYVKYYCARNCLKRVDERYEENQPYIFDCAALTKQAVQGGVDCEVSLQFKNCDAAVNFDSSITSKLSFIILGFIIALNVLTIQ